MCQGPGPRWGGTPQWYGLNFSAPEQSFPTQTRKGLNFSAPEQSSHHQSTKPPNPQGGKGGKPKIKHPNPQREGGEPKTKHPNTQWEGGAQKSQAPQPSDPTTPNPQGGEGGQHPKTKNPSTQAHRPKHPNPQGGRGGHLQMHHYHCRGRGGLPPPAKHLTPRKSCCFHPTHTLV